MNAGGLSQLHGPAQASRFSQFFCLYFFIFFFSGYFSPLLRLALDAASEPCDATALH